MGIDACIYVKTKDGLPPALCDHLPSECVIRPVLKEEDVEEVLRESCYEIDQSWRYYGVGYERGPWPKIAHVLIALFASENTESVWYFGDCDDLGKPFTKEEFHRINEHYMMNGDRPYRSAFTSSRNA